MKKATARNAVPAGISKVLSRLHYPPDLILLCVRWYVAYPL
jgi:putative transposase